MVDFFSESGIFGLLPVLAHFVIESRESCLRADDGASERKKKALCLLAVSLSLSLSLLLPSILQTTRVTKKGVSDGDQRL